MFDSDFRPGPAGARRADPTQGWESLLRPRDQGRGPRRPRRGLTLAVVVVILLLVSGAVLWKLTRPSSDPHPGPAPANYFTGPTVITREFPAPSFKCLGTATVGTARLPGIDPTDGAREVGVAEGHLCVRSSTGQITTAPMTITHGKTGYVMHGLPGSRPDVFLAAVDISLERVTYTAADGTAPSFELREFVTMAGLLLFEMPVPASGSITLYEVGTTAPVASFPVSGPVAGPPSCPATGTSSDRRTTASILAHGVTLRISAQPGTAGTQASLCLNVATRAGVVRGAARSVGAGSLQYATVTEVGNQRFLWGAATTQTRTLRLTYSDRSTSVVNGRSLVRTGNNWCYFAAVLPAGRTLTQVQSDDAADQIGPAVRPAVQPSGGDK